MKFFKLEIFKVYDLQGHKIKGFQSYSDALQFVGDKNLIIK